MQADVICEPIVQAGGGVTVQVFPIFLEESTKSATSTIPSSFMSAFISVVPNFEPMNAMSKIFTLPSLVMS